jgi:hypothetical protein
MDDVLENISKEVVVAYYPSVCLECLSIIANMFCQDSPCPGPDLNLPNLPEMLLRKGTNLNLRFHTNYLRCGVTKAVWTFSCSVLAIWGGE